MASFVIIGGMMTILIKIKCILVIIGGMMTLLIKIKCTLVIIGGMMTILYENHVPFGYHRWDDDNFI